MIQSIKKKLIKSIKKEEEEEEKEQTNYIIDLTFNSKSTEDLQRIVNEKSRLVLVSDAKDQIKTLCFKPNPSKNNQKQGFRTCSFTSTPIRENNSHDIKQFKEIRTRFEDTSSFPYSVHGVVRVEVGKEDYETATGILTGPDLVLTAAHNIYNYKESKQKYPKVEFIPGMNEQERPFKVHTVVKSYVPEEYLNTWTQEDYALLVLDGTLGVQAGYFGLHVAEEEQLKGKELNVIGYPGYVRTKDDRNKLKSLSGKGRHQLWGMKVNFWLFEDKGKNGESLINYEDILTTPGQSGSGVFYQEEETGEYYVIGVHILGEE